ncbi:hypothetical protein M8J76_016477 [Diaphorina citri]|nr:hypothetical protein M8J76_016477 [Diaphorina citri]
MQLFYILTTTLLLGVVNEVVASKDGDADAKGGEDMFRIDNQTAISKQATVAKLSDRIRLIIEHYQQEDPVGLPAIQIPDHLPVPDLQKSKMTFDHMQIYGLSQFRIVKVHTDLPAMEITMGILMSKLEILGNYSLDQFWSRSQGPFNVSLINVYIEGKAGLVVNQAGKLEADRVDTNGSMIQTALNSAGPFLFESLKPSMLAEFNVKILQNMNDNLKALNHSFEPKAGLPIDNLIRTVRQLLRERRIDPYQVELGPSLLNNSVFKIEHFVLHGLSSFYRIGDISLHMENKTLQLSLHIGIPLLQGRLAWSLSYVTRSQTCFSLKYVQIKILVNQTLNDLSKSPKLNAIDIQIGHIKLSKHYSKQSATSPRQLLERALYATLPNLVRLQILSILHQPLHNAIQDTLDNIQIKDYLTQL